jgi:hypothetical protein
VVQLHGGGLGAKSAVRGLVLYTSSAGFDSRAPYHPSVARGLTLWTFNPRILAGSNPAGGTFRCANCHRLRTARTLGWHADLDFKLAPVA